MSRYLRRAAKADANQKSIVDALIAHGCTVYVIGQPTDLLVGRAGVNYLLEVTNPERRSAHRKHKEEQAKWREVWRGQAVEVFTVEEALEAVGIVK